MRTRIGIYLSVLFILSFTFFMSKMRIESSILYNEACYTIGTCTQTMAEVVYETKKSRELVRKAKVALSLEKSLIYKFKADDIKCTHQRIIFGNNDYFYDDLIPEPWQIPKHILEED